MQPEVLLHEREVERAIYRMAREIVERCGPGAMPALLGIRSRGAHLVRRIARQIELATGQAPECAAIDITPFRDDGRAVRADAPVRLPFALEGRAVVLIDDVIHTGRTIRAALDLVGQIGAPRTVLVAALIDRGSRELPIRADIVGKNVAAPPGTRVKVLLAESDGIDRVILTGAAATPAAGETA
jgi:pyrimidine operon attenuation protein/uracil phosphoribosyltransferase